METYVLVVWLAGTVPIGICSGMGTGIPDYFIPNLTRERCHEMAEVTVKVKPGARAMCARG